MVALAGAAPPAGGCHHKRHVQRRVTSVQNSTELWRIVRMRDGWLCCKVVADNWRHLQSGDRSKVIRAIIHSLLASRPSFFCCLLNWYNENPCYPCRPPGLYGVSPSIHSWRRFGSKL